MLHDVVGGKTKAVIVMAHIGALQGPRLRDPRGGLGRPVDDWSATSRRRAQLGRSEMKMLFSIRTPSTRPESGVSSAG